MWWTEDEYNRDELLPMDFGPHTGPKGVAIVRLHANDRTDPGWGEKQFIANYNRGRFGIQHLHSARHMNRPPFAFVMRSMDLVCIDIDGKNGGLEHVGKLGMLPYTLAETSKSGNGYHLFYATSEDQWDDSLGFAGFKDRIGIQQGVDFRATGCVFHWPSQRWNNRRIEELPQHLRDLLVQHEQRNSAVIASITKVLDAGDPDEILTMQDALTQDLQKPIPAGRRNNTLFAVGSQMMLAEIPDWVDLVSVRATQVGLDSDEVDKLIRNISKYGANA